MADRPGNPYLLRRVHRISALVVGIFALVHIAHHMLALHSIDTHLTVARVLRIGYRHPWIEPLLLLAVTVQWATGLALAYRRWRSPEGQSRGQTRWVSRAQAWSGLVLSFFLPVHVLSVLQGRASGLDTNFYFAAAGLHVPPIQFFFAPYYFLAVLAYFTHLGCAAYWHLQASSPRTRTMAIALPMAVGGAISLVLVLSLAGKLQPVEVPAKYKVTYVRQGGDTSPNQL